MNNKISKIIKAAVVMVLLVGALSFVRFNNIKDVNEIYEIREEIHSLNKLPGNDDIIKKIQEVKIKKETLESFLLDKDNPIGFIVSLEKIGKRNLLETEVKNIVDEEDLVFEIVATGSFANTQKFLSQIESMEKEIVVKNMRLTRINLEEGVEWSLFLKIKGKTI